MKKVLLAGLVLLGVIVGTVTSQSNGFRAEPEGFVNSKPQANDIQTEVRRLRDRLRSELENADGPKAPEVDLLRSLDRYLAAEKIDRIISQLEEIITSTPNTDEAQRSAMAIEVLKGQARRGEPSDEFVRPGVKPSRFDPVRRDSQPQPALRDVE